MTSSGSDKQINLAIMASGSGSNAEAIVKHFQNHPTINVKLILSNKPDAYVLVRAAQYDIPTKVFSRQDFYESDKVVELLQNMKIDWIILAGFLWLVPNNLLQAYPNKIINIHPALLPKYGGKGMYGMKVHQAVVAAKEKQSGITIHLLNDKYDDGPTLFQAVTDIDENDSPETVAKKIHALEHQHFPRVIEETVLSTP
jgi:phosphoribosylglycinamide formyltransferase 1